MDRLNGNGTANNDTGTQESQYYAAILQQGMSGTDANIWRSDGFLIVNTDNNRCLRNGYSWEECSPNMPKEFIFYSDRRRFDDSIGVDERNRGVPICNHAASDNCISVNSGLQIVIHNFQHEGNTRFHWNVDGDKRLCTIDDDCFTNDNSRAVKHSGAKIFVSLCGKTKSYGTFCQNPFNETAPFTVVDF